MARMECEECDSTEAQSVKVQFGDGKSETFALCESCLHDFQDAGLINETSALDDENLAY